jgi:hypothetical protein
MQKQHRIDMSKHAVENEQQIARYRHRAKRHDGGHAKTCEYRECGGESEEIDPGHIASFLMQRYYRDECEFRWTADASAE